MAARSTAPKPPNKPVTDSDGNPITDTKGRPRRRRMVPIVEPDGTTREQRWRSQREERSRIRLLAQDRIIRAIEDTRGLIGLACRKAKVSARTHRDWLTRYPSYAERFRQATEIGYDMVEFRLLQKVDEGDVNAMKTFLSARCKQRGYGIQRRESTGVDGRPIEVNNNSPTIEDLIQATPEAELADLVGKVKANADRVDSQTG